MEANLSQTPFNGVTDIDTSPPQTNSLIAIACHKLDTSNNYKSFQLPKATKTLNHCKASTDYIYTENYLSGYIFSLRG